MRPPLRPPKDDNGDSRKLSPLPPRIGHSSLEQTLEQSSSSLVTRMGHPPLQQRITYPLSHPRMGHPPLEQSFTGSFFHQTFESLHSDPRTGCLLPDPILERAPFLPTFGHPSSSLLPIFGNFHPPSSLVPRIIQHPPSSFEQRFCYPPSSFFRWRHPGAGYGSSSGTGVFLPRTTAANSSRSAHVNRRISTTTTVCQDPVCPYEDSTATANQIVPDGSQNPVMMDSNPHVLPSLQIPTSSNGDANVDQKDKGILVTDVDDDEFDVSKLSDVFDGEDQMKMGIIVDDDESDSESRNK